MANFRQTNAGGTNGATVAAASGGSADGSTPYQAVSIGASSTLAFDNTHSLFGEQGGPGNLSVKFATAASATIVYVSWTTSISYAIPMFASMCVYATAVPASSFRLIEFLNGATLQHTLSLGGSGFLSMFDSAGVGSSAMTHAYPLNAWFRVDFQLITASLTVGQTECRLFSDPFSSVPLETLTGAASSNSGVAAAPTEIRYGHAQIGTASQTAMWMDQVQASNTAYPPPPQWHRNPPNRPSWQQPPLIRAGSW